jgi:deoxyribodipyrimidine photo-lyase
MSTSPTLLWFRQDLRLADNAALAAAIDHGAVVPVFVRSPEEEGAWPPGAASRWWLHQSLEALDGALRRRGSRLILRRGPTIEALRVLTRETGARAVYWNRPYEPAAVAQEQAVADALRRDGIETRGFAGALLFEPEACRSNQGKPLQVFTPFWRRCLALPEPALPLSAPRTVPAPRLWPRSLPLAQLALEPRINWAREIAQTWEPGEAGAMKALKAFLRAHLANYERGRDDPGSDGTSRLSPHLHFGEISPRQVWHAVRKAGVVTGDRKLMRAEESLLRQLGWREFAHHLLVHFPHTPEQPLRAAFAKFPWQNDARAMRAWQRGETGYPLVDAGMRQLWRTGWMHNRVRMVVASFLVKDLLLSWHAGARWFWDTLVDADLANNTLGWQWTGGCGADAAPYFRIFNPVAQGERFDPDGAYVRRFVPELARLPNDVIHAPWLASPALLAECGVLLGRTYPRPIVDHAEARDRALAAFQAMRTRPL